MQTTIKIFDTIEEADNAARQLYKLYKCIKHHNMAFSCNHNDRGYAMVRHGFELYIFTTKNELCKVMEKYYDKSRSD